MATLEHLLSPLALGPVVLPNRIVSTAHQTTLVHDHLPTDDFVAYHAARARGGAGLIVLEATAVHPSGLLTPHTLGGYRPELAGGYKRVVEAVRPHGTRLFVQLFHGGREQIGSRPRAPALAPSAVPSARFRVEPRALLGPEIDEIIEGYARAAELAAAGGLDGVEISAAHHYLIEQFLDPTVNRRSDTWRDGTEFLTAVLRAVRDAAPALCVGVRLSADSMRLAGVVDLLADGADYISLALGDSSTYLGSVGIVPPPPIGENAIAEPATRFAGPLPRIATSRILDPVAADRLIATGGAEAVGMTRALIADPELPLKARLGQLRELVRCVGCNTCIAHYHSGTPIACSVNPTTGRELDLLPVSRAARSRRLVVIGGGPAGIAAAVTAHRGGHDVVLLERTGALGGQLALTGAAPGGAELYTAFLDNSERQLAGVDVRLQVEADALSVLELEPDAVVVASGARPYRGANHVATTAWDVLAGRLPAGETALVADWGGDPGGLDAAEVLAAAGMRVTLAVASVAAAEGVHQYRRNLYLQRLYRAGVTIVHHVELIEVAGQTARLRNVFAPELVQTVQVDAVVLALGRVPADSPAPALRELGVTVEEAGDCRSPRSLEEAVLEGTLAARTVFA